MEETKSHGGSRAGAGRKKGGSNAEKQKTGYKTGRIVISCLESEAANIKELAAQSGKSVSQFVVESILKA